MQTLGQLVQAVRARFENSLMLTKSVMERHALDTTTALTRYKHQTLHMLLRYQFTIFRDCLFQYLGPIDIFSLGETGNKRLKELAVDYNGYSQGELVNNGP